MSAEQQCPLFIREYLAGLNTPRSLAVYLLFKNQEHDQLINLSVDFRYHTPEDYWATKFLSKSKFLRLKDPQTRAKEALRKWFEAEAQCRETNRRFDSGAFGDPLIGIDPFTLISRVRSNIKYILRNKSPYEFLDNCGFGPGSDLSTSRGFTSAYNKLSTPGSYTIGAYFWINFLVNNSGLSRVVDYDINTKRLRGDLSANNCVHFVPKNAKTDRAISVEPRWNIFLQKGVGKVFRSALKKTGISLDDQTRNQKLALVGSSTGQFATIDLRSASDTLSRSVVYHLLPSEWYDVLESLRCKSSVLPDGSVIKLEKFSSMGNGFTFELESLIFYSICKAVSYDGECSVYGDDIICETKDSSKVIAALAFFGFQTNEEKTFVNGPFRESCGVDALNGVNITPIYLKELPHDDFTTIQAANQISVIAARSHRFGGRDKRFHSSWLSLVHSVRKEHRLYGPPSLNGSIHHDKWWAIDRRRTDKATRAGWEGCFVNTLVYTQRLFRYVDVHSAILSHYWAPMTDGYSIRDRVVLKRKSVFIPTYGMSTGEWSG